GGRDVQTDPALADGGVALVEERAVDPDAGGVQGASAADRDVLRYVRARAERAGSAPRHDDTGAGAPVRAFAGRGARIERRRRGWSSPSRGGVRRPRLRAGWRRRR